MSWVFLVYVFRGPDSVGRYSELIEMVPVLYLYSVLSFYGFGGFASLVCLA